MRATLLIAALCIASTLQLVEAGKFFFLADWHVDPYYDPSIPASDFCQNKTNIILHGGQVPASFFHPEPREKPTESDDQIVPNQDFGQYGCDTPKLLAVSALTEMRKLLEKPDFIVFCGDMSAHNLPTAESRYVAINDTIGEIATAYPSVPIYPSLGNNDCYPDYFLTYHDFRPNHWLERVWTSWSKYSAIPASQKDNFIHGGYYVAQHSANLTIISLNTIYVCGGHSPDWNPDRKPDPGKMFSWLNATLLAAEKAGSSAYIIGHVPPNRYWDQTYLQDFLQIVKRFEKVIIAQMYGHTHRDEIHLFMEEERNVPFGWWLQAPSLTPKNVNNPSFRIVDYDDDSYLITDHTQYISGVTETQRDWKVTWRKEYSFREEYQMSSPTYTTQSIHQVLTNITNNPMLFFRWYANYATQYFSPSSKTNTLCEMFYAASDDASQCQHNGVYQVFPFSNKEPLL